MSKKIKILSICLFLILAINTKVFAQTQGVITGETVKLRAGAGLEYKLVTLLSVDNKVTVLEKSGDWYKVTYKGKTGYVFKDYIKVNGEVEEVQQEENEPVETIPEETQNNEQQANQPEDKIEESTNSEPQENNQVQEQTLNNNFELPAIKQIAVENAKMYILPLVNSSVLSEIAKDTKVTATEVTGQWVYISNESISGWIRKENLKDYVEETSKPVEETKPEVTQPETIPEEEPEVEEETKTKIGYVNVDVVRLREQPNTTSKILDECTKNQEVTINGEENNWCKVTVNGINGYIAKEFISDKKVETTNRSADTTREIKEKTKVEEALIQTEKEIVKNQSTSNINSTSNKGAEIVEYAKKYLGVKYVSGGSTPNGFDCSGFTSYVYKNFGYTLSRTSTGQASNGVQVEKSDLQPGDIVVFNNTANSKIGHVGIYIGQNQFIHASSPGDVVKITSLSTSYYSKRYVTSRRILN